MICATRSRPYFDPRARPRGEVALQICPPERHPRVAHFHDRRPGSGRYEQWRPDRRLGVAPFKAVVTLSTLGRETFSVLLFLQLTPFRKQLVKSALPPVMEPLHSDAACPILFGPLSGPAAGAAHW